MWEPRRLATLWASTACYRDDFLTYLLLSTIYFMDIRNGVSILSISHSSTMNEPKDHWGTQSKKKREFAVPTDVELPKHTLNYAKALIWLLHSSHRSKNVRNNFADTKNDTAMSNTFILIKTGESFLLHAPSNKISCSLFKRFIIKCWGSTGKRSLYLPFMSIHRVVFQTHHYARNFQVPSSCQELAVNPIYGISFNHIWRRSERQIFCSVVY
jgi:hypothetical protein